MTTSIKSNKIQNINENYNAYTSSCDDDMTLRNYVIRESENDPSFWGWLFDDDSLNDFSDLNDEQKESWEEMLSDLDNISMEDVAYECGCEVIETTSQRNGYPENIRYAVIGFNTFEEAAQIAKKYGLSVESFERHEGWSLWYRTGDTESEAYKLSAEEYGDDYSVYRKEDKEDYEELFEAWKDGKDEEELEEWEEEGQKVLTAIDNLKSDEAVLTCQGIYSDVIKISTMNYENDSIHHAIGLIRK